MAEKTLISWTDATWNCITGCSKVSAGCAKCYAERLSLKFGWSKKPWTARNAAENVILHPERLRKPYGYKPGTRCFTNSMSDMFHELAPDAFLADIFRVMNECRQVTFQILTKRPARAAAWPGPWTPNIWMGTSVEDARVAQRIDELRACGAAIRFLSYEPALGPLGEVDLTGYHWLIYGGESGPGFRPHEMAWARAARDLCTRYGLAFFYKQDAAFRTETRCYLVEEDGSCWKWQQYPGQLTPPERVQSQGKSQK